VYHIGRVSDQIGTQLALSHIPFRVDVDVPGKVPRGQQALPMYIDVNTKGYVTERSAKCREGSRPCRFLQIERGLIGRCPACEMRHAHTGTLP